MAVFVLSINVPFLTYCTVLLLITLKKLKVSSADTSSDKSHRPRRRKDDEIAIISRVQYRVWWLRQKNKKNI